MDDIRSLVSRAASDDADRSERVAAFAELVRRFQDMVFGYAYSLLGDFHLAEDAAQEAFITAFREIDKLREPGAFAPWLRRIVRTACSRLTRRKEVATEPLDADAGVPAKDTQPGKVVERKEMRDRVLEAIRSLAEPQRTVTTLFYINGYSQAEIADFLEVPETTVNNRLHASRKRLKQRMIHMVDETLKANAPDERFSRRIIEALLARPKPLQIEGHPIRKVLDIIRQALPDYEMIEGEEVVEKTLFAGLSGNLELVYHVDEERILRPDTTTTMIQAMARRTPPVRLLDAGRAFRPSPEDATHSHAFHQLEVLRIEAGAGPNDMQSGLRKVLEAVLGPVELRFEEFHWPLFHSSLEVAIRRDDEWLNIAGCGMFTPAMLREAGYDPDVVSGYCFGVGLDRLAMLKFGIDDIRDLWQPPYIPG